jgi:signal peptidase I
MMPGPALSHRELWDEIWFNPGSLVQERIVMTSPLHSSRAHVWWRQNRSFLVFLLCFGFFRFAVADWNPIPSGSMRPTLLEGDVVLVDRLAYDFKLPLTDIALARLGEPARGDVVTFSSPTDGTRLIKRIVALPGDTVEMRSEVLFVNGQAALYDTPVALNEPTDDGGQIPALRTHEQLAGAPQAHVVQILPDVPARRDFGPLTVPANSFFMLGDNRDNSADSRYIGMVPRQLLIGRARGVIVSADIKGNWLPRLERVASSIH